MTDIKNAKRIVIKIGTSTLTYETGKTNLRRIAKLVRVLSDLHNSGKEVVLVSSGAIGVGVGKLGMKERPNTTKGRQALASIGQCELMFLYDKLFSEYNLTVAQLLLTKGDVDNKTRRENLINTFDQLLEYGAIPIVNENDSVSVDEIVFGDNDSLSAVVAKLIHADTLIMLTDIDGLYEKDPKVDPNAKMIHAVERIDDSIKKLAGGRGSTRGTGGMITKILAAEIANDVGINVVIMNGDDPEKIYNVLEGEDVGTIFYAH